MTSRGIWKWLVGLARLGPRPALALGLLLAVAAPATLLAWAWHAAGRLDLVPETWSPRNYEDRFEGPVTVRRALEQSLNAATVRIAFDRGLEAVIRAAREVGFTSPMAPVPALALGSFEVTPLELAGAYASLARLDGRVTPTAVRAVVDRDGVVLAPRPTSGDSGRVAAERFLVTYLLRGVVDRGTVAPAWVLSLEGEVAAKTGTTNDGRDAWVVGYPPRLVALVWVGFDTCTEHGPGDVLEVLYRRLFGITR